LLLVGPVWTSAQTNTGEISGVIADLQGLVLPGAVVVAEHLETGQRIEATADDRGRFLLPGLRVGGYSLTVELGGFKRVTRSNVTLLLGPEAADRTSRSRLAASAKRSP
jgi:hypothetical protein